MSTSESTFHAPECMRKYSDRVYLDTWRGISSGEDLWFIMWEARARYVVWFYAIGVLPMLSIFRSASYSTL